MLLPGLAQVAALVNPANPASPSVVRAMEERAHALNIKLRPVDVRRLEDLEAAVKQARAQGEGLVVMEDGLFLANARSLADLASRSRLPSIGFREYVDAGGLLGATPSTCRTSGVSRPSWWTRSSRAPSPPRCPSSRPRDSSSSST